MCETVKNKRVQPAKNVNKISAFKKNNALSPSISYP